jgi:hypothetical protein
LRKSCTFSITLKEKKKKKMKTFSTDLKKMLNPFQREGSLEGSKLKCPPEIMCGDDIFTIT